ncbi:hypothetical protein KM915_20995 [Cytobacillus oceanisediminis]|uniref:hypothetical protein n=1 Tax=Cytobacillus oceanisediminis TaxID=665099 RepID=UPI001C2119DD|nr:hypothetical protein [Cytobacillus oceanisediminis]MBU8732529.1 hypothetical protein [Cytobacillus oceanisediminis]
MKTCKYCGTTLYFLGEYQNKLHFHCSYCDLSFGIDETCENRKRKQSVPEYYNQGYYKSTKELLSINTVELFHMLKECRSDWYNTFSILSRLMNLDENEIPDKQEMDQAVKPLYDEYVKLTKQKFIIENILLEKAGFVPEKITEDFLSMIVSEGRNSSNKPMYIYIKKNKKIGA